MLLLITLLNALLFSPQARIPGPGGSTSAGGGTVVTFDAVGPSSSGAGVLTNTNLSWTHVVGTGTNQLLLVTVTMDNNPDVGLTLTATYNGVSMGDSGKGIVHSGAGTSGYVQIFKLAAPATGSHTVSVTANLAAGSLVGGSLSFNGVDQTTPINVANSNTATGNSATASVVVASATGDMVADIVGAGTAISSSTQTNRWLNNFSAAGVAGVGAGSTASGAASVTMQYSITSDTWGMIGLDIKHA